MAEKLLRGLLPDLRTPKRGGRQMLDYRTFSAIVSNDDLPEVETLLAAVSGRFAGIFSTPVIVNAAADELDASGTYTGTPAAWGTTVRLKPDERRVLKSALSTIASLQFQEIDSRLPIEEETQARSFLAKLGYRHPGTPVSAYGTALANGRKPAQAVGTSYTLVNQWTDIIKMVNMTSQGQRFKVLSAGDYTLEVALSYNTTTGEVDEDGNPIQIDPPVVWTFSATRNAGVVGTELVSSDGFAKGSISGTLAVNDLVGIGVKADSAGKDFKVTGGKIRLKRVGD